ncbi:hypothetical protein ABTM92_20120, partial [Acinetobacter baumannii]
TLEKTEKAFGAFRFDHYTDALFTKEMFANRTHLNRQGADKYTRILALEFLAKRGHTAQLPL